MGLLAETKIRRAINTDPNNTKWTRDTSTFGQKILRSQGWQPGQFLGAQDAPHSNLHTSANATYIRVSLKDDMKGLGFDKAKDNEATGMDVFNDLLSRLNGKSSAAIAEDRQARLIVKMHRYVEQKWGPMRFVRGGLLVGDELKVDEEEAQKEEEPAAEKAKAESEPAKEKTSKKRKAASLDEEDDDSETGASDSDSNSKKRKKEARKSKKRSKEVDASDMNESQDDSSKLKKKDKREKKAKKQKKEKASEKEENDSNDDSADDKVSKRKSKSKPEGFTVSPSEDEAAKAKKKKEKKERKERRKEEKKQKKSKVESSSSSASGTSTPTAATDGTPAGSGTSTPRRNPHLVRSRFIAAKREALLDDKALKQILMIKT